MENMGQMERDEREFGPRLGSMLDAYADELPTPATDLVSGGLARGRRLRRRRQTLWGAAVFTVATGLAGGAVLAGVMPGDAGSGKDNQAADATVTIPDFSLAAAQTSAPAGKVAVTGEAAVATLRDLLPGKPTTSGYQWWNGKEGADSVSAGGRLLIQGRAETTVSLQGAFQLTAFDALDKDAAREAAGKSGQREQDKSGRTAPDKSAAANEAAGSGKKLRPATEAELQTFYSCADRAETGVTLASCRARNLDDGSVLISYEEKSGTLTRRTADLLRKDGTRIVVVTSNSTDTKRGPADVTAPPLTLAQLTDIAGSAEWQAWVEPSVNDGAKGVS
ncbi:hypothetical protein AB0H86_34030 [Streptomyces sp. NPDC050997]|uniref:hypothetical protein n=1 Tax=Streptomyces sp. NPDC050997 TaxID=3155519 RepID=UPI003431AA9F